jgi:hypothetical protein
MRTTMRLGRAMMLAPLAGAPAMVKADLVIDFGTNYQPTNAPPGGAAPWLRATFADEVVNGDLTGAVLVTLQNLLKGADEKIGAVAFNTAAGVTGLQGSYVSGQEGTFEDGGGIVGGWGEAGTFDFGFDFPTSDSDHFGMGDLSTFRLTATGGLAATDFLAFTETDYLAAAHVQSIGTGGTSTKISGGVTAVPEASTVVMAGLVALGGLGYGWRRRRAAA